ncbi:LacI family DNA-binding transcriptional regulator [Paenibacillus terrae]|uniref:LacI family transcriptional regulator n=1 Tax=Paenibacillus terrae (strain HPL-003) TaxID=985665 RepID=G7VYB7_PAETH|nr:LacI family DNA-binding transcriptional regulator [Paenibacillus terrae]AET57900.1 LacI family transcriptional regulator [Paenibacillus terrae HPL-003]
MKKPTIEDVAQKAGVSKSTVSQFLNKRYKYMSEQTRDRISEVIRELNYQPNGLARSLKQNRTFMVGVIVANIDYTLSIQSIRAIEEELQRFGIQVIICNADENPDKESQYIEMLKARQVDGLIIFPTGKHADIYNQLIREKYPLVFLDRLVDGVNTRSLLLDNEMAVKLAIQELVAHNHERIALITLPLGLNRITPRVERLSGYKKALEERGLPFREEYMRSVSKENIQQTLEELFQLQEPPTALLAGNDIVLAEVLKYVNARRKRIPAELSIIGIDDAEFAHIYNPPITTITQPIADMGKQAAKTLLSSIEEGGESVPIIYRFVPDLNRGESVKTL